MHQTNTDLEATFDRIHVKICGSIIQACIAVEDVVYMHYRRVRLVKAALLASICAAAAPMLMQSFSLPISNVAAGNGAVLLSVLVGLRYTLLAGYVLPGFSRVNDARMQLCPRLPLGRRVEAVARIVQDARGDDAFARELRACAVAVATARVFTKEGGRYADATTDFQR